LSFDLKVILYALGAVLQGRANFFMDDTLSGFIKCGIAKPAPLAFAHASQNKYRITEA